MTKLWVFVFLTIGKLAFGQNNQPTKSQLFNVFKKSVRQDVKGKISINSNPWVICNKDSSFYKSDTLRLYNNVNYYYHSGCCDFVDWTFYKANAYILTKAKICKEPPTVTVARNDDWFTIKLSTIKNHLFLNIFNRERLAEKFKVISINKANNIGQPKDITNVVTLVRVK